MPPSPIINEDLKPFYQKINASGTLALANALARMVA